MPGVNRWPCRWRRPHRLVSALRRRFMSHSRNAWNSSCSPPSALAGWDWAGRVATCGLFIFALRFVAECEAALVLEICLSWPESGADTASGDALAEQTHCSHCGQSAAKAAPVVIPATTVTAVIATSRAIDIMCPHPSSASVYDGKRAFWWQPQGFTRNHDFLPLRCNSATRRLTAD